jgi:hypothetical protein
VLLADFFANGDDDALPADHGAHAQRQGHGNLDPGGNELGGLVHLALVVGQSAFSSGGKGRVWFFCIRRMASLATYMSLRTLVCWLGGNRLELLVEGHFVVQVFYQLAQRKNRVRLNLLGADVVGDFGAGVGAQDTGFIDMRSRMCPACSEAAMKSCTSLP